MISMLWLVLQAAAPTVVPTAACSAVDVRPADAPVGGAGLLIVGCGTRGATLGRASRYSAVWSPVANGVLVVRVQGANTEVLLVSPAHGGTGVAINNVTRELVGLSGKSPHLGLGSTAIDTTRFAVDGSVGVVTSGAARWLDLKPYALRAAQAPSRPKSAGADTKN